jgi:hypothetical protein
MRTNEKEPVFVRGKFLFESKSGKGRLYEIYDPIHDKNIEEWFPSSRIENEVIIDVESETVEFECPKWLIEKKGFHWFIE